MRKGKIRFRTDKKGSGRAYKKFRRGMRRLRRGMKEVQKGYSRN